MYLLYSVNVYNIIFNVVIEIKVLFFYSILLLLVKPLPNSEGIRSDHQRQIRQFILLFTFEVSTLRTTMNPLMAASHYVTLVDVV